jgi:TFIIF-interacting CTD phosphatase-like protein
LTAKLSQGQGLILLNNSNNEILNCTTKKAIVAQKTTPVGPDIKNKTFAGEASWQNILAVNNKLSNT